MSRNGIQPLSGVFTRWRLQEFERSNISDINDTFRFLGRCVVESRSVLVDFIHSILCARVQGHAADSPVLVVMSRGRGRVESPDSFFVRRGQTKAGVMTHDSTVQYTVQ